MLVHKFVDHKLVYCLLRDARKSVAQKNKITVQNTTLRLEYLRISTFIRIFATKNYNNNDNKRRSSEVFESVS